MEISVDGSPRQAPAAATTMGPLLAALKEDVLATGRVVLSVQIDGHEADAKKQADVADASVGEFSNLRLQTADPKALCIATLEEVANHIQPIVDEAGRIAELIDTSKETQAMTRIGPCLDVWAAIIRAVQNIAELMQVRLAEVATEQETLPASIEALVGVLEELKASVNARDFVSTRDIMKNRMPEVSRRIAAQLGALLAAVAAK
jgi:hypothetical protein